MKTYFNIALIIVIIWLLVWYFTMILDFLNTPKPEPAHQDTVNVSRHTELMMWRVKHEVMKLNATIPNKYGIKEDQLNQAIQELIDSSNSVLDSAYYIIKI